MPFEDDWIWQARFAAHASEIVRNYVRDFLMAELEESDPYSDWKQNTDGFVRYRLPLPNDARLSRRVRRIQYRKRGSFAYEQTIRLDRPSGQDVEFRKLNRGYGDIELYGFGPDDGEGEGGPPLRFAQWFLADLGILRRYMTEGGHLVGTGKPMRNKDGSSRFVSVDLRDLPENYVLASDGLPPMEFDQDWFACRNGIWFCDDIDHAAKRWTGDAAANMCPHAIPNHARLRHGMCTGSYAIALTEDRKPGPGMWRLCLCCGFRWRAGWIPSAAQVIRRERSARVLNRIYPS